MHLGKRIIQMGDLASREEDHADVGIMHLGKRITQREDHALSEEDHAEDGGDHADQVIKSLVIQKLGSWPGCYGVMQRGSIRQSCGVSCREGILYIQSRGS